MTRWAIVSDIHGNRRALEAAERLAREREADRFVCLGDVIGRGDPAWCVAWVRDHAALAIVGNRDLDYVARVPADLQDTVQSWAHELRASDFILSHGEPRLHRVLNSGAERDGFRRAQAYIAESRAAVWFFGHTHRSRAWRITADGSVLVTEPNTGFEADAIYVVNVGTTGLPLPGRDPASFVLYNDEAHCVERVPIPAGTIVRSSPIRSVPVHV
jgi:predicted phosphodiesterase